MLPSFMLTIFQNTPPEDEAFNMFLFGLLVLGMTFICISILIAVVLILLILLIIFGCITVGALSMSVLIGINKRSFTAGFRTFVIVFSTFSFTVIGGLSFWLINKIIHWWNQTEAILMGLSVGLFTGLVTGWLIALLIKKLSTYLKNRIEKNSSK